MKKALLVLALASFPFVVTAQTASETNKVWVERYQPSDQKLIEMGEKNAAELDRDLSRSLKKMTTKQKEMMVKTLKKMESKREKLSGGKDKAIAIKGADDKSIKDYFYKASAPELYVPLTEPELVEVDANSLK